MAAVATQSQHSQQVVEHMELKALHRVGCAQRLSGNPLPLYNKEPSPPPKRQDSTIPITRTALKPSSSSRRPGLQARIPLLLPLFSFVGARGPGTMHTLRRACTAHTTPWGTGGFVEHIHVQNRPSEHGGGGGGQGCIRRERGGLGPKGLCTKDGPIRFFLTANFFFPTMVALVWGRGGSGGGGGGLPPPSSNGVRPS